MTSGAVPRDGPVRRAPDLFLGARGDPVLARADERLRRKGREVRWVDDLARAGLSLRLVDGKAVRALIHVDDLDVVLDERASVVVSELACTPDPALDETDRSYVVDEVLAAWSVLLHAVPARVVNRPSSTHPPGRHGGAESRRLARRLGIATVADHVASADDLRRLRAGAAEAACVDLARRRPFWISSPYGIEEGQLYLRVATGERRYGLVSTVGSVSRCWTWSPGTGADPASVVPAATMVASARVLLAALDLEYGFTFFALDGGGPQFLSALTSTPPDLPPDVVDVVAEDLVASLTGAAVGADAVPVGAPVRGR